MPVLLLCGEKDVQVLCSDVQALADSFTKAGNKNAEFHAIPNMIHVFRIVTGAPSGAADYTDPTKPFSTDAAQYIQTFAKSALAQ
jgi:alpha-beta hydrolase superfamily lysophospholipase